MVGNGHQLVGQGEDDRNLDREDIVSPLGSGDTKVNQDSDNTDSAPSVCGQKDRIDCATNTIHYNIIQKY